MTLDPKGLEAAMKAAIPPSKRFDLAATVSAAITAYLKATAPSGQAPLEGVNLREAAENLANFAWSAVVTDCTEAADYLNELVEKLRAALLTDIVPVTITDKDGNKRDAFVDRSRGVVLPASAEPHPEDKWTHEQHVAAVDFLTGASTPAERCRDCDGHNCDDGCAYPDAPASAEPVAWLAEGAGWKRVFLDMEAAQKLANEDGHLVPLYASPPAPTEGR